MRTSLRIGQSVMVILQIVTAGCSRSASGRRPTCHRTHSQDNPSGTPRTLPSDSLHRSGCYEPQAEGPESAEQSSPIHTGTPAHPQCLPPTGHEPACRTISSIPAPGESNCKMNPQSLHSGRLLRPRCKRCSVTRWLSQNL